MPRKGTKRHQKIWVFWPFALSRWHSCNWLPKSEIRIKLKILEIQRPETPMPLRFARASPSFLPSPLGRGRSRLAAGDIPARRGRRAARDRSVVVSNQCRIRSKASDCWVIAVNVNCFFQNNLCPAVPDRAARTQNSLGVSLPAHIVSPSAAPAQAQFGGFWYH